MRKISTPSFLFKIKKASNTSRFSDILFTQKEVQVYKEGEKSQSLRYCSLLGSGMSFSNTLKVGHYSFVRLRGINVELLHVTWLSKKCRVCPTWVSAFRSVPTWAAFMQTQNYGIFRQRKKYWHLHPGYHFKEVSILEKSQCCWSLNLKVST